MLKRNSIQMTRQPQYFFLLGQQGRERRPVIPGSVQAVSALPVLRDRWDLNPWHPAPGPGVTGICPVLPGGHVSRRRKIEAGVKQSRHVTALDTYLALSSRVWKEGCRAGQRFHERENVDVLKLSGGLASKASAYS